MMDTKPVTPNLAASITKAASAQTYYTIRFMVDRERIADAYRAYAYFRWVDDVLDGEAGVEPKFDAQDQAERGSFLLRQQALLSACTARAPIQAACPEEQLLIDLVHSDRVPESGLNAYLHNMMAVMAFDTERRGRTITSSELSGYTHALASAVTEAMHYFIGHRCYSPHDESRYLAVSAAHITHMLRDTIDDVQAGYFNIPREVLNGYHIEPQDVNSEAYRGWVRVRVDLARAYFKRGRKYLSQVGSLRCRLAGLAYTARFEWLLDTFEREGYTLRRQYNERKSLTTGLQMGLDILASLIDWRSITEPATVTIRERSLKKP